ncbi:universal stress protein [Rubrivivax rivuli]|uniref:Universal stress protein n=1 Tax=Rubrivivax rivuli TaxID=1862385 RepID=A0A437RK83_9BURK|nr:universal stress protein [Rubrivivax rivuli]RVU47196.1 universal stress protein [Rubrivivax rivuli]
MYTHLFVPVDGSELSERTFVHSVHLASKLGARITGFVAEPMPPLPTESSAMTSYLRQADEHRQRTEAHAQATLDRFAAHAAAAGVPFEGCFKRSDAVDNTIVSTAVEHGCDLLVMATHGRGALGELIFGSHTKSVISRSTLPVLVLH